MSLTRFKDRYGHLRPWTKREMVPILFGLIWLTIGSAYCLDPWSSKQTEALVLPLSFMPQAGWGVVFVFCGILAIFSSRWPPHQDTWGYVVLGCCSIWWACCFTVGAIAHGGRSWSGAAVWFLIAIALYVINDLTEKEEV